jgi:cytoplasmic iron level regulating protein YaaA (DUF328/UPF0246 family)
MENTNNSPSKTPSLSVEEYLEKSQKVIDHARSLMGEDSEKAIQLASKQLENHCRLFSKTRLA